MDHITEEHNEAIDMEHVADSALDEIQTGTIVQGEVVTVDTGYVYINVGTKSDGRIALEEFGDKPEVGDLIEVMLQNRRLVDGVYQFSRKAAEEEKLWQNFMSSYNEGDNVITGKVIKATNKGKLVDCNGIVTFLPFSLSADLKGESATESEYKFKIKSIDRKKKSIVLSRKDFIDEENVVKWEAFIANFKEGDKVKGEVVKFVEFGAFVRVEGIDALLHRNDMSWKKVFKQRKILKQNEEREFIILGINREEGKISLGLKQLMDNPWLNIDEKYKKGDIVKGTVVTLVNMGAFIEIEDGIEGFISSSDLSWTKSNVNVKDVLEKGQEVELMVLNVNKEDRKLLFGYKQTQENPWDSIHEKFPVGSIHKKKIKKIVKFGMFVELENDIDGLIHISDVSWEDNTKELEGSHKVGEEVEFKILDVKKNEMKISCGVKQLIKSPWEIIREKYKPRLKVDGTISGITQFGLFVKLEENVEGLIHISEVSKSRIEDLEEYFKVGDPISAVVLGVDVKKKRLSLSAKQFDMMSEKEELEKILKQTSSSTVTLGDMIQIKLGE